MLRRTNVVPFIVVIAMLIAAWVMLGTAVAQKAAVPKAQDKLALAENEVKQYRACAARDSKQHLAWKRLLESYSPFVL